MGRADIERYRGGVDKATKEGLPKSKLRAIRASLQAKSGDIYLPEGGEIPAQRLYTSDVFHEIVEFIVSPRRLVVDPEELNAFMDNLIEGIEPSFRHPADMSDKGSLGLGVLVFDEDLATKHMRTETSIEANNSDLLEETGIVAGISNTKSRQVWTRETRIRVYPDPFSAYAVYSHDALKTEATNEGKPFLVRGDFGLSRHFLTREQLDRIKAEYRRPQNFRAKALPAAS